MPEVGPRPRRFASSTALGAALRAELTAALRKGSGRYVALAVGSTTLPHYADLDPAAFVDRRILPVDELVPAPARLELRFSRQLRAALPAELSGCIRDLGVDGDLARQARELDVELGRAGLCACVLGLGPDGHVAFNQPPSGPETPTRVVELSPHNLERLGPIAPARRALTLGVATLLLAERVILVVDGSGKQRALERVLDGPEGPDVPASWLRRHGDCRVLISEG